MDRPALLRLLSLLDDRLATDPAARRLVHAVGEALVELASPSTDESEASDAEHSDASPIPEPSGDGENRPPVGEPEPAEPEPPDDTPASPPATPLVQPVPDVAPELSVSHDDLLAAAASAREKALPARVASAHPDASAEQRRRLCGAYAALADAATLLGSLPPNADHDALRRAVELAAEAQSALRVAYLAAAGLDAATTPPSASIEEPGGYTVFKWLSEATAAYRIYVRDYMRWQDPADPARAPALQREIRHVAVGAGVDLPEPAESKRWKKPLRAVQARAERIARGEGAPSANWPRLVDDVAKAVRAGLAESAVELREALLPVVDAWPDGIETPAEAARVRREIERFLASRPADGEDDSADGDTLSDEVAEVARLLGGRTVALFGGVPKPHIVDRIREAFGLSDVVWVETREHQSTEPFRTIVARPDVALVVLFIRWCSHSFDDLKTFCEAEGKPYVRLKAGNHPNRIAHAVLAQVGDELQRRAPGQP